MSSWSPSALDLEDDVLYPMPRCAPSAGHLTADCKLCHSPATEHLRAATDQKLGQLRKRKTSPMPGEVPWFVT